MIFIRNFTKPGDEDSASGIRQAIKVAIETDRNRVIFDAGIYRLRSIEEVKTDAMTHDAGSKTDHFGKEAHIIVEGGHHLILEGAVHDDGSPATIFEGYNDCINHSYLPSILWCQKTNDLTVRNLKFKRFPEYSSAGKVINKTSEYIDVEVFEGNPCRDDMGAYCMNRFTSDGRTLIGESVTYGMDPGENWRLIGDRKLRLQLKDVSEKVNEGEILSWHQGAQTDFQTYFGFCENLHLENIHTSNANGFSMIAAYCMNITADRIRFQPEGNLYFTCPRDAWKLLKCPGEIKITNMYIEGVRMDGQNMHSNYMFMKEKISSKRGCFFTKYSFTPLAAGTMMEFYEGTEIHTREILNWESEHAGDGGQYYLVEFTEDIPIFVDDETLCTPQCWEPKSYSCTDSTFVNIAGAGHLVRYDHLTIERCTYKNLMNSGILLGSELTTHFEGGHATHIKIIDCQFDNCGFHPRYHTIGGIGINSSGFSEAYNHDIHIQNCQFKNMKVGVHAVCARDVEIIHCQFDQVEEKVRIDEKTSRNINLR